MQLECYQEDTDSPGSTITIKHQDDQVTSPEDCQWHCQTSQQCKYFVFRRKDNSCALKTEAAAHHRRDKQGRVFGPKYCHSDNAGQSHFMLAYNINLQVQFRYKSYDYVFMIYLYF